MRVGFFKERERKKEVKLFAQLKRRRRTCVYYTLKFPYCRCLVVVLVLLFPLFSCVTFYDGDYDVLFRAIRRCCCCCVPGLRRVLQAANCCV